MENSRKRIADLDKLFSRIYEANVIGKLSDERYARMAAEYESEQKELLEKVKEEEKQLSEMEQKSVDMRLLLQGLREFTDMKELTPTIVNKLIRRIEVHNPEKKHARKSVKVDIYFTAMGLVSLPDEQEIRRMMEQMRSASQDTETADCIKRKRCNPPHIGLHHLLYFFTALSAPSFSAPPVFMYFSCKVCVILRQ